MDGVVVDKSLKINCVEISIVRIVCKACGTAMDVPLARLVNALLQCPGCTKGLRRPDVDAAINELTQGLFAFQQHKDVELHFVVPMPE